jgi:hypothetical protein
MGDDSGGGGGGGGGGDDKKDKTPTFNNLTEAANAGYHGEAVNIAGKGLQKVEFADENYDKQMSNASSSAGTTTTSGGSSGGGGGSQPSGSIMDGLQHTTFGENISMTLGMTDKTDGYWADQLITVYKNEGAEAGKARADYLNQSGLLSDGSTLINDTFDNLSSGGTGFVSIEDDTKKPVYLDQTGKAYDNVSERNAADKLIDDSKAQPEYNMFGDLISEGAATDETLASQATAANLDANKTEIDTSTGSTYDEVPGFGNVTIKELDEDSGYPGQKYYVGDDGKFKGLVPDNVEKEYNMFGDVVDDFQGTSDEVLAQQSDNVTGGIAAASGATPTTNYDAIDATAFPSGGPGNIGTTDDFGITTLPGGGSSSNDGLFYDSSGSPNIEGTSIPYSSQDAADGADIMKDLQTTGSDTQYNMFGDEVIGGVNDDATLASQSNQAAEKIAVDKIKESDPGQATGLSPTTTLFGQGVEKFGQIANQAAASLSNVFGADDLSKIFQDNADTQSLVAQDTFSRLSPETQDAATRPIVTSTVDGLGTKVGDDGFITTYDPPGFNIPFTNTNFDPKALLYKGVQSSPSTLGPMAIAGGLGIIPGIVSGGTTAYGDATGDIRNSLNSAYAAGDLQQTEKYQEALSKINSMEGAANLSSEEKGSQALDMLKKNIDTSSLPIGAIGSLQAILPFIKIPGGQKIASLLGTNVLGKGTAIAGRQSLTGLGEAGTENLEVTAKDYVGQETGGLPEGYQTPASQKLDETLVAGATGLLIPGGGRSGVSTGGVPGVAPGQTPIVTGGGITNITTPSGGPGTFTTSDNTTTPIVDQGTAGQAAQAPGTLYQTGGPGTFNVAPNTATTQDMIVAEAVVGNIIENSVNTDGKVILSGPVVNQLKSVSDQTGITAQQIEDIIRTKGFTVDSTTPITTDQAAATQTISNIIAGSSTDQASGFKTPSSEETAGIASLATDAGITKNELDKIVANNNGAPYISAVAADVDSAANQGLTEDTLNVAETETIGTTAEGPLIGGNNIVVNPADASVNQEGIASLNTDTTTDSTVTTDTTVDPSATTNVNTDVTPTTDVTSTTDVTPTTDTTTSINPGVTIVDQPEEEDDVEEDIIVETTEDDDTSTDTDTTVPPGTYDETPPSGPIVPPESSKDPETGEETYKCPDGYKLTKGADGMQCFRTTTEQRMRAGIGTRAYTRVSPSRSRRGQRTVNLTKTEETPVIVETT